MILDLPISMRYPLRKLYLGEPLNPQDLPELDTAKLSLMKLIAGGLILAACDARFAYRVMTLSHLGIDEGETTRRSFDPLIPLFDKIDRPMLRSQRKPTDPERCEEIAKRMAGRKGLFVFIGDWMDASYSYGDAAAGRKWDRTLGLFRNWGQRRPLAVVRVNHVNELYRTAPAPVPKVDRVLNFMAGGNVEDPDRTADDICDVNVEREPEIYDEHYESEERRNERLANERRWQKVLSYFLRRSCRAYLEVNGSTTNIDKVTRTAWTSLVER